MLFIYILLISFTLTSGIKKNKQSPKRLKSFRIDFYSPYCLMQNLRICSVHPLKILYVRSMKSSSVTIELIFRHSKLHLKKMNIFQQWLYGEDRASVMSPVYQEKVMPDTTYEKKITKETDSATGKRGKSFASNDVDVLQQTYGELRPGMVITIELEKAVKLLGRSRVRVDAFSRLKKVLHEQYEVELIITSRKTHGTNQQKRREI